MADPLVLTPARLLAVIWRAFDHFPAVPGLVLGGFIGLNIVIDLLDCAWSQGTRQPGAMALTGF
jgi:hypothetical protein